MAKDVTARDTKYAKLIKHSRLKLGNGHEARLERIHVKQFDQEEIRLSWWVGAKMIPRPLDITERQLWRLIAKAIREGVICRK